MNKKWSPYICMMTNSTCYKNTRRMKIKGVLWHDTGCDNVWLSRYVQPLATDANYKEAIAKLGKNRYGNDWNHITKQAGLNCWVGKFADGSVGTVQSMPWDFRPWGCGAGRKGSCNDGWIQFEICEDAKKNKQYAQDVWDEAVALTAYLCETYNIDPNGKTTLNGITVPTIICHWDSYLLGLGSGHGDIYDWFPKILGKSMDDIRKEVTELLENQKGWVLKNGIWYYYDDNGNKVTEWQKIDNVWYYFNQRGEMQKGWIDLKGKRYYLKSSGGMKTGWLKYEDLWYYLDPDTGEMKTGWVKVDGIWYFLFEDGIMAQKEWITTSEGTEYYWLSANGKWTYKYKGYWVTLGEGKKKFQDEKGWYPKDETVLIDRYYCTFDQDGYLIKKQKKEIIEPTFKVRIIADVVNVRSGPSTDYDVKDSVKKGGIYTIIDQEDNWGKLKSGIGWICLDYTERIN